MNAGGRAIGYIRVSDEEQVKSGLGLEAQEAAVRAHAKRLGLRLVAIYRDEGLSGKKKAKLEKRAGLMAAVAALRRGDVLLVAKRDRFARDSIEAHFIERILKRRGARLVSAAGEGSEGREDDPTNFLIRRLFDLLAEYESLLIGARVKAALEQKRLKGEFCGGEPPYGFRAVRGRLVVHEGERRLLRAVRALQADWGSSEREIASWLNRHGLRTRSGGRWTKTQVHRILVRRVARAVSPSGATR